MSQPKMALMVFLYLAVLGLLLVAVLGLLQAAPGLAQETPGEPEAPPQETPEEPVIPPETAPALMVTATICTEIQEREPVGAGDTFPATVGKLFCHTLVEGAEEPTMVTHVWYHGEDRMAEVALEVNSSRWRTWSSKNIMESWTGSWHVDIQGEDGEVLTTITFQIQ